MSNLDAIVQLIENNCVHSEQEYIIERDLDEKGRPFEMKFKVVSNRDIEYMLYRFESKDFPFFKEVSGLKKMCDYILFAEENNHLHIFLIELKLGNMSARKQLASAEEFAKFLLNSCSRVGTVIEHFSVKKIRICQKLVDKRTKLDVGNSFEFDTDRYLDYKLNSFHLPSLMQY